MRQTGIAYSPAILHQTTFSLDSLLRTENAAPPPVPVEMAARVQPLLSRLRLGIDMEQTSSLPDTQDCRAHEFYRDNFTPAEIAYCLQRGDPKKSPCGLWAAKEAAVKALGGDSAVGLRGIEISHDANDRPSCRLGELSISHSDDFCVAIFAAFPGNPP